MILISHVRYWDYDSGKEKQSLSKYKNKLPLKQGINVPSK